MQYFDNPHQCYNEEDFDEEFYHSRTNKKVRYDAELKQFYFVYEDAWGVEYELFTTVECIWKVTPGTFDYEAPSDWDYYGYTELQSWKVLSVESNERDEVNPKEVLTEKQLLAYTAGLEAFIEG